MRLFKILKMILTSNHQHFISVDSKFYKRWKYLVRLTIKFNKSYKYCEIHRKRFKHLEDFVVVGLKYNGKNVKRRTAGFAKEFVDSNKNSKCIYCSSKLTLDNATTDHIVPISEGGNNSQVNLIVCCESCNTERGNADFTSYLKMKNKKFRDQKFISI